MTKIERLLNDDGAFRNFNDGNPLRHNDDQCGHQIVIFIKMVSDAAPWNEPRDR